MNNPIQGVVLDVDSVLAGFSHGFLAKAKQMGYKALDHWTEWDSWSPPALKDCFGPVWDEIKGDHAFWLSLPPFGDAFVNFPVSGYCTARPVPSHVTAEWLSKNGFPDAPVVTVGPEQSKIEALRGMGCKLFVDDKPSTFHEVNAAGIPCLLRNRPHNLETDSVIGGLDHRIHYLVQVPKWIAKHGYRCHETPHAV